MSAHLQLEIERLKRKLLALSALVEHRIHEAVRALHTRDGTLARGVIDGDSEIDQAEVEVEEECLKILALYQPVASDLRFIVAVLKINHDLERIGDLAVNIARKALAFAGQTEFQFPFDLVAMSRKTEAMLHDALDCLVHLNADQARAVCERDREINDMKRNLREQAEREMRERPPQIPLLLRLLGACRNLERVADQAANIAEDVVYLVHGEIIRHQPGAGTQRENGE
ncbi:MAG: phosphate signaling complex protein PhoU [Pirellulaceae bacterium]|jgi:phosphate transport system protein|nr:phosphate signaling complex protein PhoU [Pirellulaceae bacterium]